MNDLETTVLRLIGENITSPDVFTDDDEGLAQIRDSLNAGIQELSMVKGQYARTFHLPLIEGRQWYYLMPYKDFIAYPISVFDRTNKRKLERTSLLSLDRQDPFWMQTSGTVHKYLMVGDYFGAYRVPSASGIVLEMKCICIPAAYTSDTAPIKLRPENQRATVALAVSEYYASRGDAKRATEYLNRYLESGRIMHLSPVQAERVWQAQTNQEESAG